MNRYRRLKTQKSESLSTSRLANSAPSNEPLLQRAIVALAFSLMLVTLWGLVHRYQGLFGDARLYALQALARLHPGLANDLFLQNASQDRYTIFSPLYAMIIKLMGLQHAAVALSVSFTVWFLGATWVLARQLAGRDAAWLVIALLIMTVGRYGGGVAFHFSEDFLTARSLAEAL